MTPENNKEYFHSLTSLRGIASLWVAIGHISWTLPSSLLVLIFPIIRQGYLAVDFFFILSGFVLAHAYKIHMMETWMEYLKFCRARIFRIFPIHIFILTIFGILYLIFLKNGFILPGIYDLKSFLAELFLLHITPLFDIKYFFSWNYPSWTLVLEVWYFIILTGFIILINKIIKTYKLELKNETKRNLYIKVICVLMLVLVGIPLLKQSPAFIDDPNFTNSIIRSGIEFLVGFFIYQAFIIKKFQFTKKQTNLIYFFIILGIFGWFFIPRILIISGWLLLIPFILIQSLDNTSRINKILTSNVLIYLGNISYSLYIIHGPIERIISVIYTKLNPTMFNTIFLYLIFIISTITLAHFSYKYIEKPLILYFKTRK